MIDIFDGILSNPIHGIKGRDNQDKQINNNNVILYNLFNKYLSNFMNLFNE